MPIRVPLVFVQGGYVDRAYHFASIPWRGKRLGLFFFRSKTGWMFFFGTFWRERG